MDGLAGAVIPVSEGPVRPAVTLGGGEAPAKGSLGRQSMVMNADMSSATI